MRGLLKTKQTIELSMTLTDIDGRGNHDSELASLQNVPPPPNPPQAHIPFPIAKHAPANETIKA